jgi:general secretion pathway protein I
MARAARKDGPGRLAGEQLGAVELRRHSADACQNRVHFADCGASMVGVSTARLGGSRGFTLIEALVALTILSMILAAIADLSNTTLRGVVHVERSLARVEVAEQILATLPARGDIGALSAMGRLDGHAWRLDAEPYRAAVPVAGAPRWVPAEVELSVRDRSGAPLDVEMVRLVRPRAP